MSGPKVITYTMNAFKGSLKDFLSLQSRLMHLRIQLQKAAIEDKELNIRYDCKDRLKAIETDIEKALIPLVFDYKGTIDEKTYRSVQMQIADRTKQIENVISKMQAIETDFNLHEKDFKSYVDYLSFSDNAKTAFEKFKKELSENTKKNFADNDPGLTEETLKKYGSVVLEKETVKFDWGFDKLSESQKKAIFDHVTDKENQIREIRDKLLDKIITQNTAKNKSQATIVKNEKISPEIQRVSVNIKQMMHNCNDKSMVKVYSDRFNQLLQSESMNDVFFYKELHDHILENESSRKNKCRINEMIADMHGTPTDPALEKEKKTLVQKAVQYLNCSKVTDKETESLLREMDALLKKNTSLKEAVELRKKEQLFMKTRIIQNFESMGYNVLDNLEVIDFENESDFYLQAPGQENVLNIKFKEDGSFRYVFQIPQKKEALSTEEQKMKLHEMKNTCDDFVEVLKDLKSMGVDIKIESDKPIELDSMITLSEALQTKFKARDKRVQRKEQIKKLYLK
jgi:hypothetical protein